jgi:hypothetical protein
MAQTPFSELVPVFVSFEWYTPKAKKTYDVDVDISFSTC